MQKLIKIHFTDTLHYIYVCVWNVADLVLWTFRYKMKKETNYVKNVSMRNEASSFSFMFSAR